MNNAAKVILATSLNIILLIVLNYYDLTKLFLALYLIKFLDTSVKSFFPCTILQQ